MPGASGGIGAATGETGNGATGRSVGHIGQAR